MDEIEIWGIFTENYLIFTFFFKKLAYSVSQNVGEKYPRHLVHGADATTEQKK